MWSFPLKIEANQRLQMLRILLQKSRFFKLKKIVFLVYFSFFLFKSLKTLSRHKLKEINCKELIQARTFLRIYLILAIKFNSLSFNGFIKKIGHF